LVQRVSKGQAVGIERLGRFFAGHSTHGPDGGNDIIARVRQWSLDEIGIARRAQKADDPDAVVDWETIGRVVYPGVVIRVRVDCCRAAVAGETGREVRDGVNIVGEIVQTALAIADRVEENAGILVDDGFLAIVFLHVHRHGEDANDGDQSEADHAEADGDLD